MCVCVWNGVCCIVCVVCYECVWCVVCVLKGVRVKKSVVFGGYVVCACAPRVKRMHHVRVWYVVCCACVGGCLVTGGGKGLEGVWCVCGVCVVCVCGPSIESVQCVRVMCSDQRTIAHPAVESTDNFHDSNTSTPLHLPPLPPMVHGEILSSWK